MQANYHTHSKWCRHGEGEIEEYIEEAIRCGLQELAITEHVPHKQPRFSWVLWEQFPMYDIALNSAIEKYRDRIHVIKGFECEYYPEELDHYRMLRDEFGYELLALGQHTCGRDPEINIFAPIRKEDIHVYAEDVCKGLETGLFRFLAHPDCILLHYPGPWDRECEKAFACIFQACQELDIPVEINANGLRDHRRYPCEEAFLFSKNYHLKYIINSDAHKPENLCDQGVRMAEAFAAKLDLEVLHFLDPVVK